MDLAGLIPKRDMNIPLVGRDPSGSEHMETTLGFFKTQPSLSGDDKTLYTYYVNLIHLLDLALTEVTPHNWEVGDLHQLSPEQTKLIKKYFEEADVITPASSFDIEELEDLVEEFYKVHDFTKLTDYILILDDFLGSWFGVEDGEYTRYDDKKQLYCKRKPFSKKAESITGVKF